MSQYARDQFWALKEVLSKKRPERSPVAKRCLLYVLTNLVDRATVSYSRQPDFGKRAEEICGLVSRREAVSHEELNMWRCLLIERVALLATACRWKEARSLIPTLEQVM